MPRGGVLMIRSRLMSSEDHDHTQPRQHVLDLAFVEKAAAANNAIGDLPLPHFLFENPNMAVGAEEQRRKVVPMSVARGL